MTTRTRWSRERVQEGEGMGDSYNRLADEAAYFGAIEDYKSSQPRALSAVSEDGNWHVELEDGFFIVWFWARLGKYRAKSIEHASEDTGQGAEDVLREWMDSRS